MPVSPWFRLPRASQAFSLCRAWGRSPSSVSSPAPTRRLPHLRLSASASRVCCGNPVLFPPPGRGFCSPPVWVRPRLAVGCGLLPCGLAGASAPAHRPPRQLGLRPPLGRSAWAPRLLVLRLLHLPLSRLSSCPRASCPGPPPFVRPSAGAACRARSAATAPRRAGAPRLFRFSRSWPPVSPTPPSSALPRWPGFFARVRHGAVSDVPSPFLRRFRLYLFSCVPRRRLLRARLLARRLLGLSLAAPGPLLAPSPDAPFVSRCCLLWHAAWAFASPSPGSRPLARAPPPSFRAPCAPRLPGSGAPAPSGASPATCLTVGGPAAAPLVSCLLCQAALLSSFRPRVPPPPFPLGPFLCARGPARPLCPAVRRPLACCLPASRSPPFLQSWRPFVQLSFLRFPFGFLHPSFFLFFAWGSCFPLHISPLAPWRCLFPPARPALSRPSFLSRVSRSPGPWSRRLCPHCLASFFSAASASLLPPLPSAPPAGLQVCPPSASSPPDSSLGRLLCWLIPRRVLRSLRFAVLRLRCRCSIPLLSCAGACSFGFASLFSSLRGPSHACLFFSWVLLAAGSVVAPPPLPGLPSLGCVLRSPPPARRHPLLLVAALCFPAPRAPPFARCAFAGLYPPRPFSVVAWGRCPSGVRGPWTSPPASLPGPPLPPPPFTRPLPARLLSPALPVVPRALALPRRLSTARVALPLPSHFPVFPSRLGFPALLFSPAGWSVYLPQPLLLLAAAAVPATLSPRRPCPRFGPRFPPVTVGGPRSPFLAGPSPGRRPWGDVRFRLGLFACRLRFRFGFEVALAVCVADLRCSVGLLVCVPPAASPPRFRAALPPTRCSSLGLPAGSRFRALSVRCPQLFG